ncbi:MAG: phenylacetate--CoA ligase [Eubacteriales bacterium]|nr:phenylacetate--CoA ligase [Eubacteriales bacterium]MDD4743832.1 phenylacetate--CoA ligase [Eubacteriales bacterium]
MNGYIWNTPMETMSEEQMRELQGDRLVACVRRMYGHVPYYTERMKAAGVTPDDIRSLDDLAKLPFTDKDDMRDNYPYGTFAVPLDQIVRIHASSGTTGKQKVVGYTQKDIELWSECCCRALAATGMTASDILHVAYGYGLFTGGLGLHYGAERMGVTTIPVSSGNTKRQIQILVDFQPTALACTPSYALHLADELATYGVDKSMLKLKVGIFGAEPWSLAMKQQIEDKLNLRAFDIYGLSETLGPGVSISCEAGDLLHIQSDHFIAEVIDPVTGVQLPDGSLGELVFSSVTKEGTPLLRYNTHDLTRLYHGRCDCGRTTVRMEKVTGRADDMLIIRGVNVFPTQIESVLLHFGEVEPHYMIYVDRVNNLDQMEVQIEMTPTFFSDSVKEIERTERKLYQEIQSTLGISAKIRLVEPRSLPRSEGKAKRVVDRRTY